MQLPRTFRAGGSVSTSEDAARRSPAPCWLILCCIFGDFAEDLNLQSLPQKERAASHEDDHRQQEKPATQAVSSEALKNDRAFVSAVALDTVSVSQ